MGRKRRIEQANRPIDPRSAFVNYINKKVIDIPHILLWYLPCIHSVPMGLTDREAEICFGLLCGYGNKELAQVLGIGLDHLKKSIGKIMDRAGLTRYDRTNRELVFWYLFSNPITITPIESKDPCFTTLEILPETPQTIWDFYQEHLAEVEKFGVVYLTTIGHHKPNPK